MKGKLLKGLRSCGALVVAFSLFFSAASMCTVHAGYSTATTVSVSKPGYGMVNVSSGTLNVRKSPSTNSAKVASLAKDSFVMIVGQDSGFYMVQYDKDGNYGYVSKNYVDFWQSEYYLKVKNISGNLNMRAYASTDAAKVASIPANKSLAYYYDVSNWYCGLYGNVTGTVSASYVTKYSF